MKVVLYCDRTLVHPSSISMAPKQGVATQMRIVWLFLRVMESSAPGKLCGHEAMQLELIPQAAFLLVFQTEIKNCT